MTALDFRSAQRCGLCGYRLRGLMLGSFRVNKDSLKSLRPSLTFLERVCPECHTEAPQTCERWVLSTESQAKVAAIRERKGWAA